MTGGSRPQIRVLLAPYYGDNPYQKQLKTHLRSLGVDVRSATPGLDDVTLEEKIRRSEPDIVHFHWLHQYCFGPSWPATAARTISFVRLLGRIERRGMRLVWTVHNLASHDARGAGFERLVQRRLLRRAAGVIVHAAVSKSLLAGHLGTECPETVRVIPHGSYGEVYPNATDREAARRALGIAADRLVFLLFGRLRPYKGMEELLTAFDAASLPPESLLLVAGNPPDEQTADDLRRRIGSRADVMLRAGFVPDDEVQTYMHAADVVVLPYRRILTSGAAILAMTFGKPIVAPRIGELPETVGDEGGVLYDPDAPAGLAEAVARAARERDRFPAMGERNRVLAASWTWESVARETLDLYRDCLGRPAGHGPAATHGAAGGPRFVYFHPYSFPGKRAHTIQAVETCRALAERGNEVFLFVSHLSTESVAGSLRDLAVEPHPQFHLVGLPRIRLGPQPGTIAIASAVSLLWMIRRLSRRRRTVLFLRTLRDSRLCRFLIHAARLLGIPLIYEAHKVYTESFQDREASDRSLERIRDREARMVGGAHGVVVSHPLIEGELRQAYRLRGPVAVVPNGVRMQQSAGPRDRYDAVYSGSLFDWKGVDICVEAVARVPGCRLAIVGGNPKERLAALEAKAAALGVADRVTFLGQRTRAEALAVVESARMALVPLAPDFSEGEKYTCPLKMLEAMACGVPVIATDTPAVRTFLADDETGLLVPQGDVEAMAAAIRRLLASAELAGRVAAASRELAATCTYAVRAERLDRFARELLERS